MDEIIGTAILDRRLIPQQLVCLCKPEGKPAEICLLPVYPAGAPKPPTANGAAWCYHEQGDVLAFTPSVHILRQQWDAARNCFSGGMATQFHNAGSWSVKFREAAGRSDDPTWATKHLWAEIRAANPGLI
jgi:hypothetical protein